MSTETELTDEVVQELGFTDLKEFFHLVSSVPLLGVSQGSQESFRNWQYSDGSKQGLLQRFPELKEV